jgi:hypothetical protein
MGAIHVPMHPPAEHADEDDSCEQQSEDDQHMLTPSVPRERV